MDETCLSLQLYETVLYPVKVETTSDDGKGNERPEPSPRERLLDAAGRLFYHHGFHTVGIDRLIAESGVAKMSLYRNFGSKDELIAAYIERADEEYWEWIETAIGVARTPEEKLVVLFETVAKQVASPECAGCVFQAAAVAFPDREHPAHRGAVAHKKRVRDRMAALALEAGLRAPEELAAQLLLLMDGAWVAARVFDAEDSPIGSLTAAARALIAAHRDGPATGK